MNTPTPTPDDLFKAFAAQGQPPRWALRSGRRDAYLVMARAAIAVVMREGLQMSWSEIGRELCRDHSRAIRLVADHGGSRDVREMASGLCVTLGLQIEGVAS